MKKLTEDERNKLRKLVEEQLKDVPEGERIILDDELLEQLLFEEFVYDEDKNLFFKVPVWSGKFLRKIDLSRISFDNVFWGYGFGFSYTLNVISKNYADDYNLRSEYENKYRNKYNDTIYSKYFESKDAKYNLLNGTYCKEVKGIFVPIDYSDTNANIDLTRSFFVDDCIRIEGCNFEGLNLIISCDGKVYDCDFDSSNLKNVRFNSNLLPCSSAYFCDLTNVDLSSISIDGTEYLLESNEENYAGCILTNTGANIKFDSAEYNGYRFDNLEELLGELEGEEDTLEEREAIVSRNREWYVNRVEEAMNKYWVGCYVNGKLVHSPEERDAIKQREENLINIEEYITNSIQGQIGGKKK